MTEPTICKDPALYDYLLEVSLREHPVLQKLRRETARLEQAAMQTSPEQGQFLYLLARLLGVRRAIEVGTFTGYSTLCLALALPEDGKIVACDLSREWTDIGRRHWKEAGQDHKIDLRLAPAAQTLQSLLDAGEASGYDLAFIDADKTGYHRYFELCLQLVHPGGVLLIDNTLWEGKVLRPEDEDTRAIDALNRKLTHDPRIELCLLPIRDGLTLIRKS